MPRARPWRPSEEAGLITDHLHVPDDLPTEYLHGDRRRERADRGPLQMPIRWNRPMRGSWPRSRDARLGSAAAPHAGPIALDGNLTPQLLSRIAASPLFVAADLRVAPASPGKAERLLALLGHPHVTALRQPRRGRAALPNLSSPTPPPVPRRCWRAGRGGSWSPMADDRAAEATAGQGHDRRDPPQVLVTASPAPATPSGRAISQAKIKGMGREAALEECTLASPPRYVSGEPPA